MAGERAAGGAVGVGSAFGFGLCIHRAQARRLPRKGNAGRVYERRPECYSITMRDPLSLAAGLAERLALAALLIGLIWFGVWWAL